MEKEEKNLWRSLSTNKEWVQKRLTPREQEVLGLIAEGEKNTAIARKLFISTHTVKNHISSIYRKLGIQDRTQLALLAVSWGMNRGEDETTSV